MPSSGGRREHGVSRCRATYDVHRTHVFGRTEPRTGIDPFMNLVTQS
ncbi:hypothetical protein [Streptomyces sp. NPDC018833]